MIRHRQAFPQFGRLSQGHFPSVILFCQINPDFRKSTVFSTAPAFEINRVSNQLNQFAEMGTQELPASGSVHAFEIFLPDCDNEDPFQDDSKMRPNRRHSSTSSAGNAKPDNKEPLGKLVFKQVKGF